MDVAVRFVADQAPYVRERIWHPSQQLEELPDGRVVLRLRAGGFFEIRELGAGLRSRRRGVGAGRALREAVRERRCGTALRIGRGGCDAICRRSALVFPQATGLQPGGGSHGRHEHLNLGRGGGPPPSGPSWRAMSSRAEVAPRSPPAPWGPSISPSPDGRHAPSRTACPLRSAIGSSASQPRCRTRSVMAEPGRTCFRRAAATGRDREQERLGGPAGLCVEHGAPPPPRLG